MSGGAGGDSYQVENAGDVIVEAAGEGFDEGQSEISYRLADNVETLILTSTRRKPARPRRYSRRRSCASPGSVMR